MIEIDIGRLCLVTENPMEPKDGYRLKGFFANLFPKHIMLHNHLPGNKFRYQYPEFQYKVIGKRAFIIGIGKQAISFLPQILEKIQQLDIGEKKYLIKRKALEIGKEPFGISTDILDYELISPWLALNSNNYKKYCSSHNEHKISILTRCLNGNLLSISRCLNYEVDQDLYNSHELKSHYIVFQGKKMIGFTGTFHINFYIPDLLGLGKGSSYGQGCCVRLI